MTTRRDLGFVAVGVVAGPLIAAGVMIGAIAWTQPMGAAWIKLSNESWHHIMVQLTPWPHLLIDGEAVYPQVAEAIVDPVLALR